MAHWGMKAGDQEFKVLLGYIEIGGQPGLRKTLCACYFSLVMTKYRDPKQVRGEGVVWASIPEGRE